MNSSQKITEPFSADFLKKASSVANYYGFLPLERVLGEAKQEKRPQVPCAMEAQMRSLDSLGGTLTGTLKTCVQWGIVSKEKAPAFVFSSNVNGGARAQKRLVFGLHAVGTTKSVAEAMVLRAALAILEDTGVKNPILHINSMGDRDSMARFGRELGNFYKKHAHDLPASVRELSVKEPLDALAELMREEHALYDIAPRSVDFLSEASRRHFREIIEFLENIGVTYEINEKIIGNKNCYSQTVFEIRSVDGETGNTRIVARGGRYDEFSKRFFKAATPAVGLVLSADAPKGIVEPPKMTNQKPKVFFVQLGFEARLKGFTIVEILRHARIPLRQALGSESLSEQLQLAERLRIPYSLIMGYKEALEHAVIVRDMETRAQDTIPVHNLAIHLKKVLK